MASKAALATDTERGRKYAFWKFVRQSIVSIGLLAGVTAFLWAFVGVGSIFFDFGISEEVLAVVSPAAAGITFGSLAAYNGAKREGEKYVDPQFNFPAYEMLLKALRQRGVKRPISFLSKNPEYAATYRKVLKTAYAKIEAPYRKESVISALNVWKISPEAVEEHKVAALVLPGSEELARFARIEHLINDRGIRTYAEIKGLIEQDDAIPQVLTEGSL